MAALIEARSLERFQLLATHLSDRTLAGLYGGRLRRLEAEVVAELPFAARIHSGLAT